MTPSSRSRRPSRATEAHRPTPRRREAGAAAILQETLRALFAKPAVELDGELRKAMRRETEMFFAHIVREDRSLLELLDSDYTFLNERLAKHYGIPA